MHQNNPKIQEIWQIEQQTLKLACTILHISILVSPLLFDPVNEKEKPNEQSWLADEKNHSLNPITLTN